MNANIQTLHFEPAAKLVEYVNKKLSKLSQFHDRIKDKIVEIKVHVPRHDFFVKHGSKSFEESFDMALDSVINQIKRHKEKQAA